MPDVVMPRLSDSMEEGTIVRWCKRAGELVARGDELVEIETDKATVTVEADADGPLEPVAAEGETLPVGALIARLGGGSGGASRAGGADGAAAPVGSHPDGADGAGAPGASRADGADGAAAPGGSPAPAPVGGRADGRRASPVARRLARELGVDLAGVRGSGPGGRIVKADVVAAGAAAQDGGGAGEGAGSGAPAAVVGGGGGAAASPPTTAGRGAAQVVRPSRLQQLVARRMAETKATVPEFAVSTEVDMAPAAAAREQLKASGAAPVPSFNDMVVKAAALALREQPRANGAFKDGAFELYERVNVGIAVAAEDALVVPTLFDADRKSLATIAGEARRLAQRVRDGQISPPELSGATFTVSNLGMLGVTGFAAILNAGQAAILAVGAVRETPVVRDGAIVPGVRMTLTLTCDHRILYGADAARLLARIRALLEAPLALAR